MFLLKFGMKSSFTLHGTGQGQGQGNDGFLHYTMYCTHYTGTGTGNHCFLLCPFYSQSRAVCMGHKALFTLWKQLQFWVLKMPLPCGHLHLVPQYPFVTSAFDEDKIMKMMLLPLQFVHTATATILFSLFWCRQMLLLPV